MVKHLSFSIQGVGLADSFKISISKAALLGGEEEELESLPQYVKIMSYLASKYKCLVQSFPWHLAFQQYFYM